jgi:MFS superfamily sulfate permease-like transporter
VRIREKLRIPGHVLRQDALASVVVFLVALPLCMGIAIASGVPPAMGLITGIVGGLVVGVLAGSPLQVSGPAAGLAVIVYDLVREYGLEALGPVVLLAGLIQTVAGLLRLGQWFRAVSPAVIQGMLAGIGVLIFASQFHVMVDRDPFETGLMNIIRMPESIYHVFNPDAGTVHHFAAGLGILTIVTIVLWKIFGWKRLPPPLPAVVLTTTVAALFSFPITLVEIPDSLVDAMIWPSIDAVMDMGIPVFLLEGAAIAFIASAESLLCATAVDQMQTVARTQYDRELAAQGTGNMLCGAMGALPMTGVIVRSAANVEAGATTRASAILHGAWLLVLVVVAPQLLEMIPQAVLAGILVYTGYRLVDLAWIRKLRSYGRGEVVVYSITVAGVVAIDLLAGVLIGIGAAGARLLWRLSQFHVDIRRHDGRHDLTLRGTATFLGLPKLARVLESLPEGKDVHIYLHNLRHVDHACIELLGDFQRRYENKGGTVSIEWEDLRARYEPPAPPDEGAPSGTEE